MKRIIFLFTIILIGKFCSAQFSDHLIIVKNLKPNQLLENPNSLKNIINNSTYQSTDLSLKFINSKKSINGTHYRFQLLWLNIPIESAVLNVFFPIKSGEDPSIIYPYFNEELPKNFIPVFNKDLVWTYLNGQYQSLNKIQNYSNGQWYYLNENKDTVYKSDSRQYFNNDDSLIKAYVFYPDPLSSTGKNYGDTGFIDNGDLNSIQLFQARVLRPVKVKYLNNRIVLANDIYTMNTSFGVGTQAPIINDTIINLPRNVPGFEWINSYYHITSFTEYINNLGFQLPDFPISIDPHYSGNDASFFQYMPAIGSGLLAFGDGGIDDAEDADALVHEAAHAVIIASSLSTPLGSERRSMDEGICDYFAASYSKNITTNQWTKVFNWDGNGTWQGRSVQSGRKYPLSPAATIWLNGQIISEAMMRVRDSLGSEKADSIFICALYSLSANSTMVDYARAVYACDTSLFAGANTNIIRDAFEFVNIAVWPVSKEPIKIALNPIIIKNSFGFGIGESLIIEKTNQEIYEAEILDIQGKILDQFQVKDLLTFYHNHKLSKGIYFLKIKSPQNLEAFTYKLIRY